MGTDALQVRRNGDFYYPIYFEDGFEKLADAIRTEGLENRNFCIVTDTNVAPLYAAEVQKVLSPVASKISVFTFEAGEKSKNLNTVQQLYKVLIEEKLDRKSLIIALGGGVVGDLAGFGAATYLRGIDFIQVPTTLLSQVDSSVGGKTGVDLEQYKNMVGAFHQPRLVYMNLHTLRSLPAEQFAIQTGHHPAQFTKKNVDHFREQIQSLGFSYDWDREISTTDPSYYKWTQWIFLQLFKKGLAYKKEMAVNWCTSCKVVLANEEVVNGTCERCHSEVIRKVKSQWICPHRSHRSGH